MPPYLNNAYRERYQMKHIASILALAGVFALPNSALASESVASCQNLEYYQQDESGKGSFKSADMSITVSASTTGKYGYAALIVLKNGKKSLENDTQLSVASAAEAKELRELASLLLPNLNWQDVTNVRTAIIGVKADRDDAGGINLYELLAKDQKVLGRIARVGWGFGRCQ